jgi:hypothetical protein
VYQFLEIHFKFIFYINVNNLLQVFVTYTFNNAILLYLGQIRLTLWNTMRGQFPSDGNLLTDNQHGAGQTFSTTC